MIHTLFAAALLAGADPAAMQDSVVSTPAETREVSLTVYNQSFAVIRERRDVALHAGANRLRYEGVAREIEPATVRLRSLTAPGTISVREQNYQFDVVNPNVILDHAVGRRVRLVRGWGPDAQVLEGTLLSAPSSGGAVLRTDDGRLLLNPGGEWQVTELPPGLALRPSLLWMLSSARGGPQRLEVSYISGGMTWAADYVAVLDAEERHVDLSGWVTLTNQSGTAYADAALQLLAGDVRVVTPRVMGRQAGLEFQGIVATAASDEAFREQGFFEYHLYTLDGRTTLANNETKQIGLLDARGAGVRRRLVFDSRRAWGWDWRPGASARTDEVKAAIVLEMRNSAENGLGRPLPAGTLRLYKADDAGSLQFLGEDRIDHTPRDETLRLYVGDAFDVVATRKVVADVAVGTRARDVTISVNVRNHKDTSADVTVVEHFWSNWSVLSTTHPVEKKDAATGEIPLRVPANSEATVTLKVHVSW